MCYHLFCDWYFLYICLCWKISTSLQLQYHYVSDSKNWTEAQTYCRETYTDLATIENTEEMNKVEWKWSDGYTGSGAEFRSWETSDDEPDFVSANQFLCDLNIWLFTETLTAGTQLEPEYVVVNEAMNWSSAQRHCRENFIDLVTVRNDTENTEIQNLVPSGNWAWTGLSRDPNFYWSDQSNFSFSNLDNTANLIGSMRIICGNWTEAQTYCRETYTDLATIENTEEMNQLINTVSSAGKNLVWVGLYRQLLLSRHPVRNDTVICGVAFSQRRPSKLGLLPCETRLPFVCSGIPPPRECFTVLQWKTEITALH
uniref:C-type lectin domain-containing protein n=1 Tax=Lates calcarifer TaxID=8187 RepID=A0A4W6DFY2_LATCA